MFNKVPHTMKTHSLLNSAPRHEDVLEEWM